jgi:hypothetical protein
MWQVREIQEQLFLTFVSLGDLGVQGGDLLSDLSHLGFQLSTGKFLCPELADLFAQAVSFRVILLQFGLGFAPFCVLGQYRINLRR